MLYKIADLYTEIPTAGDLISRCMDYIADEEHIPDIVIREENFMYESWKGLSDNDIVYMESGIQFYIQLLSFGGMMLHASAVNVDEKAYLFSGNSGVGKSTHTKMWKDLFLASIINDDKPALRYKDNQWIAYGTPWSGKHGLNENKSAPIAGICFLKQSERNEIRRLTKYEAINRIIPQTLKRFTRVELLDQMLNMVELLVEKIPVYELENRPEAASAELSYKVMSQNVKD